MRLRPTALLLPLFGLVPSLALALALGDIEATSALNEPFEAEIAIVSATPAELERLTVQVAPRETFERYGLERPEFLSNFVFTVDRSRNVLRVRSRQPVAEPFVTFLVEAQWRRGRLLREYTVLLDPPVFMPTPERAATPAPAPVLTPRSVAAQPSPTTGVIERPRAARARGVTTPAGPVSFGSSYGPVRRGETLWNIAERLRTDRSLTTNQVMVAIYRSNPGAFLGNINLVREGATLRIPDRAAIERLSQQDAFATAVAHNDAWRAGTPAAVASVAAAPGRTVTPAPPESSRLKLVEPDLAAPGGRDAASGAGTAASDAAARAALARNEAEIARLADENDQLRADLEEIRRLISLKDSELATMQRQLAESAAAPSGPGVATAPTQAPTIAPDPTVASGPDVAIAPQTPVAAVDTVSPAADPVPGDVASLDPTATEPGAAATSAADSIDTPVAVTTPEPATTTDPVAAEVEPQPAPVPVTTSLPREPGFFGAALGALKSLVTSLWFYIALGLLALGGFAAFALRGRGADEPDALEALTAETKVVGVIAAPDEPGAATRDEEVEFFDDSGTFKPVDFAATQATEESAEYPFEDTVGASAELKLDQADPMAEADFHMAYGLYDQAADLVRKAVAREPDRVDLRMKLLEIYFVGGNQDDFRATALDLRDNLGPQIESEWDKIVIMGKQICPDDDLFAGDAGMATGADIDLEFDAGDTPQGDEAEGETLGASPDIDLDFGDEAGDLDLGFGDDTSSSIKLTPATPSADQPVDPATAETTESTMIRGDDDDDGLDFDLGLEYAAAAPEPEPEPEPEAAEQLREQIKSRLSSTDTDETAEMDLSDLGVDLDLGTGSAPALADTAGEDEFADAVFSGEIDATSEMPMPTAELTAGAPGLDLDIGTMFGDDTASNLQAPDTADTGQFSAEIETLHGDALDVDISSFGEAGHDETRLIGGDDDPTGAPVEEAFSVSVFGDETDSGDQTRLIGPDQGVGSEDDEFSASVFGNSEDETVLTDAMGQRDDLDTDMFNFDGDYAGEDADVDLDIGASMDDSDGDKTTVKVATADLALPSAEDELGEVGTKLDLARAYVDMGDPDGARGILEEVLVEGNESQQADAREMLEGLS